MSKHPGVKDVLTKPVKKADILVAFIIDRSSSMWAQANAVITGFNEYKATQVRDGEKLNATTLAVLTTFNENVEISSVGDITSLQDLTAETYVPSGCTALYDAIGQTVAKINLTRSLPDKVLVVIQTDGYENSSRQFNQKQIFDLIAKQKNAGWAFAFLGADLDAFANGTQQFGIAQASTFQYAGINTTDTLSTTASNATWNYRTGSVGADTLFVNSDVKVDPPAVPSKPTAKKKTTPSGSSVSS